MRAVFTLLPLPPPGPVGTALYQLLVIQAFRPDRLMAMATIFVTMAMGEAFQQQANQLDLAVIVENEVSTSCCVKRVTLSDPACVVCLH